METDCPIKIAVTYEDGQIFQHFGQTKQFKLYDVANGELLRSEVVTTGSYTHCSLGEFLCQRGVTVLICGGLGAGASNALLSAGILVYAGNSGSADEAVTKLLNKQLIYTPNANCHHEHGHNHHHGGGCH